MSNIVKKNLLNELMTKQLKNITPSKRLRYKDLSRIAKHLDSSIFADEKCSFWTGYITNINNTKKGIYINFYFKQKKVALHRLLYANFVGSINHNEYLKFSCEHRGRCCNLNHLVKYTKVSTRVDSIKETDTRDVVDSSIFTISFD
jgi:hypothetical protein